ncbi:MAG: hypothetical protein IKT32_00790, partial [Clostridia bacterium]|nr:hypothetical protein [Clostridia bacterium]
MKEKKENIIQFSRNEKTLRDLANSYLARDDKVGALSVYLDIEKECKFGVALYRDIANLYMSLEMYNESINYWFKYLNFVAKYRKDEAYNGLAACFSLIKMRELSIYYFNLQLEEEREEELPYDDFLYETFYSEVSNSENDEKIKLVDASGERDLEKIIFAKDLYRKDPTAAYEILKEIQEESSNYELALLTLASFYMLEKRWSDAADCYNKISQSSENFACACNNLFATYFLVGDFDKADGVFNRIVKFKTANFEQLTKFFNFMSLSLDSKAVYLYAKYLNRLFFTPRMSYFVGVAAYNDKRYNEAYDCFFSYFKATNSYIAKHNLNLSKGMIDGQRGLLKQLSFSFTLDEIKIDSLEESAVSYFSLSKKELTKKREEIFDFAQATFYTKSTKLQIVACQLLSFIGGERVIKYLKNILLVTEVCENVKIAILSILVELGNDRPTGVVYAGVYSRVPYEKVEFTEECGDFFLSAYAIAFGR